MARILMIVMTILVCVACGQQSGGGPKEPAIHADHMAR